VTDPPEPGGPVEPGEPVEPAERVERGQDPFALRSRGRGLPSRAARATGGDAAGAAGDPGAQAGNAAPATGAAGRAGEAPAKAAETAGRAPRRPGSPGDGSAQATAPSPGAAAGRSGQAAAARAGRGRTPGLGAAADRSARGLRRLAGRRHDEGASTGATGEPDQSDQSDETDRGRLRTNMDKLGDKLDRAGGALMKTGVGAKPGAVLKVTGKGTRVVVAAAPLALLVLIVMLVVGIVPTSGVNSPDFPPAEASEVAASEVPSGYMDAYAAADDEHRVPWPVLAAMGYMLTEHGARSPYDTLRRSDDQRYPRVDPAIAPGTPVTGVTTGDCRARIVGDSLLAGMRAALEPRLDACTVTGIDASDGRTIDQGADALAADPLVDETALVVVLGTNDLAGPVSRSDLDRRIDGVVAAAGGRPVIWQNSAAVGLAADPDVLNRALTAATSRHANLLVADWVGYLAGQPDPGAHRAADGVHYTPAGYELMADWLARQVAAPDPRTVEPPVGDGGLGPLLLNPAVFTGLTVRAAQDVDGAVDQLAAAMADIADKTRTNGAEEARPSRFAEEFLPESEEFWHSVVAAAPVVAGDSACLQPDPSMPVQQVIEVVWRCEMLRTPPTVWTPEGLVAGAEAQNQLLLEAHVVAATWSNYGTSDCDAGAPYAGVFPLPATALADRCDPIQNTRTAARLVLDQESQPFDQRRGATEWERAAAGWATLPIALGDGTDNRFMIDGPPVDEFQPSDPCLAALDAVLFTEEAARPAFPTLAPLGLFAPNAVDFDAAHWDRVFVTTPLGPLFAPGGDCDPGAARASGFAWLAGQLAARQPDGNPNRGLAGAIDYANWVGTRGAFPVAGQTGLVPRLHNPRLVPPRINRPPVTGGAVAINPSEFADRVIEKAKVYAGYAKVVPVEVTGWEVLAALGIPEHAARAYVRALDKIEAVEPGCSIDLAYLAGFGHMESGHGTVAVSTSTGKSDGPAPRAPVRWDPVTGESEPRILGLLLDGSGAGGNTTPHPNDLSPQDRNFYGQDDAHLRAVGPTQFMPATWESVRSVADGNDDGVADPFNYYDGALATAVKTCRDGGGLATRADQRRAALAYNGAGWYADGVMSKAAEYRAGLAAMGLGGPQSAGQSVALPDGPITLVDVYGIQVNAAIADQVSALIDAARADGLELAEGAGGWRSPERQIELRRAHCGTSDYAIYQMPSSQCSPPTAPPGTSEHERGLAIDFRCNGEAIGQRDRSNPCFLWLRAHAAEYGLFNLPSEAWHWSTSGR
jgi:D-alanyl-D-alanine carboxypeptidase